MPYLQPKARSEQKPVRDFLISHSLSGKFAIRKGDWKLITSKNSGGFSFNTRLDPYTSTEAGQLYNLKTDLTESQNVYHKFPEIVNQLSTTLDSIKAKKR